MIKELLNMELNDTPIDGLNVRIIKKDAVKKTSRESFVINNFSILLIKSGKFKVQLKDIIQDVSALDLIVVSKDSFCTLLEVDDKMQLFLVSFTPEFAFQNCFKKELVERFCYFKAKPLIKITLNEKDFLVLSIICKLIYFVNAEAKTNSLERELLRISFNLLLLELRLIYAKYTSEPSITFSRKESLVVQFLAVLSIHCKKQHSVQFYAGVLCVTSGHLNKIAKQITGKTVKALIAEAIIIEAKDLLEASQLTIAVIAEELEFANASTFSVFFKRHTSFSPSEFRSNTTDKVKIR